MIINKQADFMRVDMNNNYMYTRFVDAIRKKMAKEGRDFDEELQTFRRIKQNAAIENLKEDLKRR